MNYKIIFETERLIIRQLKAIDKIAFFDMMGNPNVMKPIPQNVFSKEESDEKLIELISYYKSNFEKKIWAISLKDNTELIGLCGLIINNENNNEIAYRLREKFWNYGYGTEIAKGLINYGFEKLNFKLITADAFISNKNSIKIIEKFMVFDKEFYNEKDQCIDRRYKLSKSNWSKKLN
ncbi:MAG: GNAT family N-acetyltransferase [Flavobacteriaceae bacterium]|nr:GNAT family N-acetyltransferase [Flavobacteriaceae bacterium]